MSDLRSRAAREKQLAIKTNIPLHGSLPTSGTLHLLQEGIPSQLSGEPRVGSILGENPAEHLRSIEAAKDQRSERDYRTS